MSDMAWPLNQQGLENIVWFSFAVTYDFLATKDINRDRVQDVIFLYKNTNSSNSFSQSCADEGKKEELPIRGGILAPPIFGEAIGGISGISFSLLCSRTRKRQGHSQHPPCLAADPHGVNTGAPRGWGGLGAQV